MMEAAAASIIRACGNLKSEVTGTSETLVPNRTWNCIPHDFNMAGTTPTLRPSKCRVRNEAPNLETTDMIMGCLVMAITQLTGWR